MTQSDSKFAPRSPRRRAGFSFIEVLFAVMLLGIGFIMIAGVFPVALQQTQITANETEGALVARDAIRQIQQIASQPGASALFQPPSTTIVPLTIPPVTVVTPTLAQELGTNAFFSADRRFAWVAFYRRPNPTDPFIQLYIIVLQNPNFQQTSTAAYFNANLPPPIPFTDSGGSGNNLSITPPPPPATTTSRITAQLAYNPSTGVSYTYLSNSGFATGADPVPNATTGAFMLVADDPGVPNTTMTPNGRLPGTLTGRFFRLGAQANPSDPEFNDPSQVLPNYPIAPPVPPTVFQLEPGQDLNITPAQTVSPSTAANQSPEITPGATFVPVYIIGRAPVDQVGSLPHVATYTGANQDIAAMTTVIRINTSNN